MKYLTLFLLIYTAVVGAQAAPKKNSLDDFFKNKTKIENPIQLRDPFKAPIGKNGSNKERKDEKSYFKTADGQYSNIQSESIKKIEDIKVVGVLIGKERRAMVTSASKKSDVIVLKEGMKIGEDGAELKAILPGGIILVEKIINVYGQEEYLETVIPISK
jgi:hypothetical protein